MRPTLNPAVCTAAAGLLWAALAGPAVAGNLTASASQNLSAPISNSSAGASVSAAFPDATNPVAEASATRTLLTAISDGTGVQVTQARAASAGWNTNYTLWDLGTNAALDGGLAAGLVLSFNFHVTGNGSLPAVSLSTAALDYNATVFSVGFQTQSALVNAAYGPIAPFPSTGYDIIGDASLLGVVDRHFSLLHNGSVTGLLTGGVGTQASNAGDASLTMAWESVTLQSGVLPVGGLALILETGQTLAVSAVPEASTIAMFAAGLAALGLWSRRRGSGHAA